MEHFIKSFSIIHRQAGINLERALKCLGVPYGQFMYIICICENEGLSQERLSCELQIDKGSVARTVKQLEEEGFISRLSSTQDRRQNQLFPTEKSKQLYPRILQTIENEEAALTERFSDIEKNLLKGLLEKIIENL